MIVIGFSGKIGCGKTHLADCLAGEMGRKQHPDIPLDFPYSCMKVARAAFGDALKSECSVIFGFPREYAYSHKDRVWPVKEYYAVNGSNVTGWNRNEVPEDIERYKDYSIFPAPSSHSMTVRDILQWWGTDVRREMNPLYWVNKMSEHLKHLERERYDAVIVDDVRFLVEAQLLKGWDGLLVRLNPYDGWTCDPAVAAHESETALDDYGGFHLTLTPAYGNLGEFVYLVAAACAFRGRG